MHAPAARQHIPWHQRLEARVLVAVTLIAGLSLASITYVTGRVVESESLKRAREDLSATRDAFTQLITDRADFARSQARLIAALPVFKAHMTDSRLAADVDTMDVMVEGYRSDLGAAFSVVTASDGRWLASPGAPTSTRAAGLLRETAAGALARKSVRRILALDGRVFLVVSEPVTYADEVLGTLTFAYGLDDEVARNLERTARSHVAFVTDRAISGSSLAGNPRQALQTFVEGGAIAQHLSGQVSLTSFGDAGFVGGLFPLEEGTPAPTSGSLILLEETEPTRQFIDQIARQLLWTGALVFVIAIGGSVALGRRMSRPLREIADTAGEIAGGRWERRVPIRGSAEAKVMADAFNGMTESLSHWHAEARRRTTQLQAAYDRYAAVTNSTHDAILSADATGAIVFWNRSATSTFGYTEKEAMGLRLTALVSESSRGAFAALLADVTAHDSDGVARTFEGEGVRKEGHTFPFELSLSSWRADGFTFLTAIVRDITERRRAQEALQQRDAQLRQAQKMEAIGRLASGVAHDFNNALAVIQGYTEQVMLGVGQADEHYDDLNEVLKASQSAASLTRQLLAFSRKQSLEPQVLSISEVVSNVRKMLQRLVGAEVELVTHTGTDDDRVYADRGQLEQVIVNLCVNARDAMPDGGRVEIAVDRALFDDPAECSRLGVMPGEFVTLSVRDTGHGIPPDVAAHIFEPFFTTKESGKGTGLGLATVYGIVTQSGGAIELDTAPGQGTTFSIHLPAAGDATNADLAPLEEPSSDASGTVLLVEDEEQVRVILGRALGAAGYRVLEAGSGPDALDLFRAHADAIDVVLTDIVMPGMSGLALSEALVQERPGTRVLFMSGHAADAVSLHGFDPSRGRLLHKPFSTQTLCRELRGVLASPVVH